MATFYSDQITLPGAADLFRSPAENYGRVRTSKATFEATTAELAAGDILLGIKLQSHAVIQNIDLYNDDLDGATGLTFNLGLYWGGQNYTQGGSQVTGTFGGVISPAASTAYASASSALQTANKGGINLTFANRAISAGTQQLWQDAGLSADCKGHLLVGLGINASDASVIAGNVLLVVEFVID